MCDSFKKGDKNNTKVWIKHFIKKLNLHKYVLYMCSLWFIFDTNDNIDNDMIIVFSFKCLK